MEKAQEIFESTKIEYKGKDDLIKKSTDVYDFLSRCYDITEWQETHKHFDAMKLLCEICVTLMKTNKAEVAFLNERNIRKLSFGKTSINIPNGRAQKVLNITRKLK